MLTDISLGTNNDDIAEVTVKRTKRAFFFPSVLINDIIADISEQDNEHFPSGIIHNDKIAGSYFLK